MKFLICFFLLFFWTKEKPQDTAEKVINHWIKIHNNIEKPIDVPFLYVYDVTLESMMVYGNYTGDDKYLKLTEKVMGLRGISPEDTIPFRLQPFCSINFLLGEYSKNKDWFKGFIVGSERMRNEVHRTEEGAIMLNHEGNHYVLIDYLQEYTSRMAKTGYLTNDESYFEEVVKQFSLYRSIVKYPETGLYSQGRGWLDDKTELSPGAWSRGHGWVLRGLVTSMLYMPEKYQNKLKPILKEVAEALMKVQADDGMWHIMLHLPVEMSAPDVSGTGMIAYYLATAIDKGWLTASEYEKKVKKASLKLQDFVSDKGEIISSSKGPGPLYSTEDYINYTPEIDEKHGFQGMIYGMLAQLILADK